VNMNRMLLLRIQPKLPYPVEHSILRDSLQLAMP